MKKTLLFLFLFTSLTFYSQIQAVDDYFNLPLAETMGGTTPSVLENDLLNGLDLSDIKITIYSEPIGFSMNQDGTITVKAGTTPGIYNFIYSVCEKSIICGNNATITINTINATPISDLITDCGSGYFDLTKQNLLLIGNLNPNEAIISYHLSFADATRGTNAITNPEKYSIRVDEQIIYTRINNAGSISLNYFSLVPSYISITSEIRSFNWSLQIGGMIHFSISHAIYPLRIELMNSNFNLISSRIYEAKRGATISDFYDNLFPGLYFINVIDKNDCSSSFPFNIAESPLNFTTTVIGKTMTVDATGGIPPYQYIIDDQFYTNNIFSGLSVGSHTVEVFDSNTYHISGSKVIVTIEEPTALYTTTTSSIINCYGDNNGSIALNATGGYPPYMYSIDGSSYTKNNIFDNLVAGIYTTYVKDVDGTIVSNVATIEQPATPLLFTTINKDVSCTNNGSIIITATGGEAPYTYSIDGINYDSKNVFSDLWADIYTVNVKDSNGCISTQEVMLYPLPDMIPSFFSVTNVSCNGGNDGTVLFDTNKYSGTYTYEINGGTPQTGNVISGLSAGTYFIGVTNSNAGCGTMIQITITEPAPLSATIAIESQSITMIATGGTGLYKYSLDGEQFQSSTVFNNVVYGEHEIHVKDQNGCVVLIPANITPSSPLIDDKDILTIEFKPGQTLGDLVVKGQNIKWYSNQNPLSGKTTKTSTEATLPLTTLLVDGTTYYASQTINGIESVQRLAITAKLSGTLSTPDAVLPNFRFYPNPVQHTLIIDNASTIDEIEIVAVSGKSVLVKKINNTHSEINLSNVSTGFYFLKVKAEGKVKTIKIVKK